MFFIFNQDKCTVKCHQPQPTNNLTGLQTHGNPIKLQGDEM